MNLVIKRIKKLFLIRELKKQNTIVSKMSSFDNCIFEERGYIKIGSNSYIDNSIVGSYSYMGRNNDLRDCKIGRFCSIGNNVKVVNAFHPSSVFVSTHPCFFSTKLQSGVSFVKENKYQEIRKVDSYACIIGNDVWIGNDVRLFAGITIGNGAIIGTGAIVTKDVPPYAIVVGAPAKVIKYRFNQSNIDSLLKIQWWNNSNEWFFQHANEFENIDVFLQNNEV